MPRLAPLYEQSTSRVQLCLCVVQYSLAISVLDERWWDIFVLEDEYHLTESRLEMPEEEVQEGLLMLPVGFAMLETYRRAFPK